MFPVLSECFCVEGNVIIEEELNHILLRVTMSWVMNREKISS
jgi:hypothetical protein